MPCVVQFISSLVATDYFLQQTLNYFVLMYTCIPSTHHSSNNNIIVLIIASNK